MKTIIFITMAIGSYAGSYIPVMWGGSVFSMTSILLGGAGGIAGVFAGFKIANRFGLE
ncbi:MAG: hypothetical protein Q7S18_01695 [bacterium]|nr:hypothetical protein [bacterium]